MCNFLFFPHPWSLIRHNSIHLISLSVTYHIPSGTLSFIVDTFDLFLVFRPVIYTFESAYLFEYCVLFAMFSRKQMYVIYINSLAAKKSYA
jgi:hypothetical protein